MKIDELRDLLNIIEIQVKITLCEDNDEECGDLMEELDFHIACYVKKHCEEQKEKVDSGNVVVDMIMIE